MSGQASPPAPSFDLTGQCNTPYVTGPVPEVSSGELRTTNGKPSAADWNGS